MRLEIPSWDIADDLLPKGAKSNVVKWSEILNSEVGQKVLNIIQNDILGVEYNGNELALHALKNAERQGMIKVLRKIYSLSEMPRVASMAMPEPFEHLGKPTEEEINA